MGKCDKCKKDVESYTSEYRCDLHKVARGLCTNCHRRKGNALVYKQTDVKCGKCEKKVARCGICVKHSHGICLKCFMVLCQSCGLFSGYNISLCSRCDSKQFKEREKEKQQEEKERKDEKEETVHSSSLNDEKSKSVIDIPIEPELRIMAWNIETLGGGFRHPPKRDEKIIKAIALTIANFDPHICGVMEVMFKAHQYGRRGKKIYKRKKSDESGKPPGLEELNRIKDKLDEMDKKKTRAWKFVAGEEPTGKETYAFFYQSSAIALVDQSIKYLNLNAKGTKLYFPKAGFREPMVARFKIVGKALSTKRTKDWVLPFVLFHAPSPSHGSQTVQALKNFARLALFVDENKDFDIILAADTNVNTGETLQLSVISKVEDALSGLDEIGALSWAGQEHGEDTTLRRSVKGQEDDEYEDDGWIVKDITEVEELGKEDKEQLEHDLADDYNLFNAEFKSPEDFRTASYDKLLLVSKMQKDSHQIHKECILFDPDVEVIDILEAVSPGDVLKRYAVSEEIEEDIEDGFLFETVKDLYKEEAKELGFFDTIRLANQISDHLPLLMKVRILAK